MSALDFAPIDATRRVQQSDAEDKAAEERRKRVREDALLRISNNQDARAQAEEDRRTQDAAAKSQLELSAVDIIGSQMGDDRARVPWHQLPADVQNRYIEARPYSPEVTATIPERWNKTLPQTSGVIPGLEGFEPSGATVNAKGEPSMQFKPKAPQVEDLTDDERAIKESIVKGDMPPPTMRGGMPPAQRARIMGAIARENGPDSAQPYDATEYPKRQAAKLAFSTGKQGDIKRSANVVIHHMGQLKKAADDLNNSGLVPWNATANTAKSWTVGNPELVEFESKRTAVATELAKAMSGGVPTQSQMEHFREMITPNMTPKEMGMALESFGGLLRGQLSGLEDQWRNSVKIERDIPFLTPESIKTLKEIGHDPSTYDPISEKESPPAAKVDAKPKVVRQNGVTYTLQPDGSYK